MGLFGHDRLETKYSTTKHEIELTFKGIVLSPLKLVRVVYENRKLIREKQVCFSSCNVSKN